MKNTSTGNKESYLLYLIIVLLGMPFASSYQEPVGIVTLNDTDIAMSWNQGRIANETYYNISSGLMQHANTIERLQDVIYLFGFAKNISGTMGEYGLTSLPGNTKNATDWASYYWLSSEKTIGAGSANLKLVRNHSQRTYDDTVLQTFSITPTNIMLSGGNNYYLRGFLNLDVDRDGIADMIRYYSTDYGFYLGINKSANYTLTVNNVRMVEFNGITYSYSIAFTNPQVMIYNKTNDNVNGDVRFYEYVGNLPVNQTYTSMNTWIDATCTITCSSGSCCDVSQLLENGTGTSLSQGETYYGYTARFALAGLFCEGGEYIVYTGAGCTLTLQQNTSTAFSTTTTTDVDRGFRCGNTTCIIDTGFNTSYRYTLLLKGSALKSSVSRYYFYTGPSFNISSTNDSWQTKQTKLDVALGNPQNDSGCIAAVQNGSCVFNGTVRFNWTASTNPGNIDNLSIYLNNTKNQTFLVGTINFSKSIIFDALYVGYYNWQACYSHNCWWGRDGQTNGSNTFWALYWKNEIWLPINQTNTTLTNSSFINATNTGIVAGRRGSYYDNFSILLLNNDSAFSNNSVIYSQSNWSSNISQNYTFTGCGWYLIEVQLCFRDTCIRGLNGSINVTKDCLISAPLSINITLWLPENGNYSYTDNITFFVNITGNYPDNVTLQLNNVSVTTLTINATGTWNITLIINNTGNTTWDFSACKDDNCSIHSWNGLFWINVKIISNSYVIWIISGILGWLFLKRRKHLFPVFVIIWGLSLPLIEETEITTIISFTVISFGFLLLVERITVDAEVGS